VPEYGYKNHVSIDRRHGLFRRWRVSDAAAHDGRFLKNLVDHDNTASPVWADTAYRSRANERFLDAHGKVSKVQFRRAPGRELSKTKRQANAARARVRALIEHVFAQQKAAMGVFVRTIGLARTKTKIALANLTYNMRRLAWLEAGSYRPRVSG
jgi:IS5 family transposase